MRVINKGVFQNWSWAVYLCLLLFPLLFCNIAEAVTLDALVAAAENGSIEDQYKLGKRYIDRKEYKNARKWLSKAAERGYVTAQTKLGWLYEHGKGVKKDYEVAFSWYEKAANQGDGYAQRPLGKFYELGLGVYPDPEKAAYWYEKAAQQGIARAQANLGILYETGVGVTRDYEKAVFWYKKTTEQGYPRGQFLLGQMYERGLGVEKNEGTAKRWYRKSASSKYSRAINRLKILEAEGLVKAKIEPKEISPKLELTKPDKEPAVDDSKTAVQDVDESSELVSDEGVELKPDTVPSVDDSKTAVQVVDDSPELISDERETIAPEKDPAVDDSKTIVQYADDSPEIIIEEGDKATLEHNRAILKAQEHFVEGNNYFKKGQMKEAALEFERSLVYNPGAANTLANLGITYAELGRVDEGIKLMRDSISSKPTNSETYALLGMMLHSKQKVKEALVQYQNAIKNNPTMSDIYFYMAFIYTKLHDYNRAWKCLHMSELFGYQDNELRKILISLSNEPEKSWPPNENGYYLRQLVVPTKERAQAIRQQLADGADFSELVKSDGLENFRENGGYMGYLKTTDIAPDILKLIKDLPPFSFSDILETDGGFHIFQPLIVLDELYAKSD